MPEDEEEVAEEELEVARVLRVCVDVEGIVAGWLWVFVVWVEVGIGFGG